MRWGLALSVSLLLVSCDDPAPSEIAVRVRSTIPNVAELRVDATFPSQRTASASARLREEGTVRTLVLLHERGPLGPIELRVSAHDAEGEVAATTRVVSFAPGEVRELEVVLGVECAIAMCPDGQVCGNEGGCRDPLVRQCELDGLCSARTGIDAGQIDGDDAGVIPSEDASAPVEDAGACPPRAFCGVRAQHLPGDWIRPQLCEATSTVVTIEVTSGGEVVGPIAGRWPLKRSRSYEVRAETMDGCVYEHRLEVVRPFITVIPDDSVTPEDIDADGAVAYVATSTGIWGADRWRTANLLTAATPMLSTLSGIAVAVHTRGVLLASDGGLVRFDVGPGFEPVTLERVNVGASSINAIASTTSDTGALIAATDSGTFSIVADEPFVASQLDETSSTWATLGEEVRTTRGPIWVGSTTTIQNLNLGMSRDVLAFGGASVVLPTTVGAIARTALDEPAGSGNPERLRFCGASGVAYVTLDGRDWTAAAEFPPFDASWSLEGCEDLAPDGTHTGAWVATVDGAVVRLTDPFREGVALAESVRLGPEHGITEDVAITRLAYVEDGGDRALWLLAPDQRYLILFLAEDDS